MKVNRWYNCPDCHAVVSPRELKFPLESGMFVYVCPECGVIQEKSEVERQLGKIEEE